MITALCLTQEPKTAEFVKPAFEPNAENGLPEVPEGSGYGEVWQEGMAYRFSLCGNVRMEGTSAVIYFTNPAENDVWLKLRFLDERGGVRGETGILRPGEYVRSAELSDEIPTGTELTMKVMSYEPETYISRGTVTLRITTAE